MSSLYDPLDEFYAEESSVRLELARVQQVCHECRRCVDLCESFGTLFELLDAMSDPDAGQLTPAQQDRVVNECVHCTLCASDCPASPPLGEVDVPRLMLRARAMQFANGHLDTNGLAKSWVLARPDLVGRVARRLPGFVNGLLNREPGSWMRRALARLTGVSDQLPLGAFALQPFSEWFAARPRIRLERSQSTVTVFPTCLIEYQATAIGMDLVKVYERNGVECNVSSARCCGAPLLHSGDVDGFGEVARSNLTRLAAEIREGTDIVVAEPGCAHVLTVDSADYVTTESERVDAALVASRTFDASSYLVAMHRGGGNVLDASFGGRVHQRIVYRPSEYTLARRAGLAGRDLMRLTGAQIDVVERPPTVGSLWSIRRRQGERTPSATEAATGAASDHTPFAYDSYLTGLMSNERSGAGAQHPLQVVARAYGIPEET